MSERCDPATKTTVSYGTRTPRLPQPPRNDQSALDAGQSGGHVCDTPSVLGTWPHGLTGQSLAISRADHPHGGLVGRKVCTEPWCYPAPVGHVGQGRNEAR